MNFSSSLIEIISTGFIAYFLALGLINLIFTLICWKQIIDYFRARTYATDEDILKSPFAPVISVLLPAFNEQAGIVESVRSLLGIKYPSYEIVVINDGSNDGTLDTLKAEFNLAQIHKAERKSPAHAPLQAAYISTNHKNLVVLDKLNGGKADALNCGIAVAKGEYFCAVDADTMLEEDSLLKVVKPVLDDPKQVIATGGIVRIANGCKIDHGRVTDVGMPKSRLAGLQIVEYFRAFLVGRVGWDRLNSLLIISGAFGLFNRKLVKEAGGYWTETVGEDAEIVVRLHRQLRTQKTAYKIAFVPDPVCWTEAPETFKVLSRQRRRWQRGLGETLRRHAHIIFNPRYGLMGLVAMPYFIIFEFLGPLIELLSLLFFPLAFAFGLISLEILVMFLFASILMGIVLSLSALALEEFSIKRHTKTRDLLLLIAYSVIENFGYRQLTTFWRLMGTIDLVHKESSWGNMTRTGLGQTKPTA